MSRYAACGAPPAWLAARLRNPILGLSMAVEAGQLALPSRPRPPFLGAR